MCQLACFAHLRRLKGATLRTIGTLAAIAVGSMVLGSSLPAQASAELFNSLCARCHNNSSHPKNLVYNAAGNAEIIETLNALGMGSDGSAADNISIAAYLDSIKPTVTLASVAHNSPGTVINLGDITVSAAEAHAFLKIIETIETVSPPKKGTVWYEVANGFAKPSIAHYTPFPGESGTDTWTYQGTGARGNTTIRTASVNIAPGDDVPAVNYQGLWWNSPAGSESGWGINFAHQGDTIFASWFTFDTDGSPLWMVVAAPKTGDNVYSGSLVRGTGPAYNAVPFNPAQVVGNVVGTATFTFTDATHATFTFTVGATSITKNLVRQEFAAPVPSCAWNAANPLAAAANFQDLWWAAPAKSESGWGINLTHQGDTIFGTWFTFGLDGKPLWMVVSAAKTAANAYAGKLYKGTGPAYNAPFDASKLVPAEVGIATFTFTDGANGTFVSVINGETITKPITREIFNPPGTVCH
jgi:hypothetical protein